MASLPCSAVYRGWWCHHNHINAPSRSNQQPDLGLPSTRVIPLFSFFWNIWLLIFCWYFTSFSSVVLISHFSGFTNLFSAQHDHTGFGKPLFYFLIHIWCLWKIKCPFLDTTSLEPNFVRSVGEAWKHPLQTFWIDHLFLSGSLDFRRVIENAMNHH